MTSVSKHNILPKIRLLFVRMVGNNFFGDNWLGLKIKVIYGIKLPHLCVWVWVGFCCFLDMVNSAYNHPDSACFYSNIHHPSIHWPLPRGNRCLLRPSDPPGVLCDSQSSIHKRLPGSCMTRTSSPWNILSGTARSLARGFPGWGALPKLFPWNNERNSKSCSDLSREGKSKEDQM